MRRQRGAALIVAMLVVALAAMTAAGFLFRTQVEWRKLENAADLGQARWILRAAEQWGAALLQDDARQNNVDHLDEIWARELPPVEAEGYRIAGRMADLDGRFNINNLVAGGRVDERQLAVFRRLLGLLDLPEGLADAAADWVDGDDKALSENGAESGYYLAQRPARQAPNRPLIHLNELLQAKGMNADILDALRPFVAVLPSHTRVNVNTAPPEVLAAVIAGLAPEAAYDIAAKRRQVYFRNLGDLQNILPQGLVLRHDLLSVSSRYFLITARARHQRVAIGSRALLERSGQGFPQPVWRAAL